MYAKAGRGIFFDIAFIIIAAVFVLLTSKKPVYNWDMVAYMGVVVEYSEHDMQKVHDSVYHALQHEVPPSVYYGLTNNIDDRHACLVNAKIFGSELSFFRAKPLYTFFVYLLHNTGISLVNATLIPSIIACFCMIILIYHWLSLYVKRPAAFILASLIALLPIFSLLDQYSTPDAISNFFVLASLFLLATHKKTSWIILCLLLSILARIDNFILAAVVIYFMFLKGKKNVLLSFIILGGVSVLCVILIPLLMGDKADWFTKFAFLTSPKDYIQHWRDLVYTLRHDVMYLLLIPIVLFMLWKANAEIKKLTLIIMVTVVTRLILFPSLQERFFAAYEFTIILLFIHYMSLQPVFAKLRRPVQLANAS